MRKEAFEICSPIEDFAYERPTPAFTPQQNEFVAFKLRHLSYAMALCRDAKLVVPVAVELNSEQCSPLTKDKFASVRTAI